MVFRWPLNPPQTIRLSAAMRKFSALIAEALRHFFALGQQGLGHIRLEGFEKLLLTFELSFPLVRLEREELSHRLARDIQFREIEVLRARDDADLGFRAAAVAFAAVDD